MTNMSTQIQTQTVAPERKPAIIDIEEYRWGENYDLDAVFGLDDDELESKQRLLRELCIAIVEAETTNDWKKILKPHVGDENSKLAQHVLTYNITSATDCVHLGKDACQVPKSECYAYNSETQYKNALHYRRRQEILWDHLDAQTFADAFLHNVEMKDNPVSTLRINQSGELRNQHDLNKVAEIASRLNEAGIDTYIYSTQGKLDWSVVDTDHLGVRMSNQDFSPEDKARFAYYTAIPLDDVDPEDVDWLDDDARQCPYDKHDGAIECGNCELCLHNNGVDVYINQH